jgi:rare lipoprotein A
VKVTNTKNQKSVEVRVNDRGPTQAGRIIDLSSKAAHTVGISPNGTQEVQLEVLEQAAPGQKKAHAEKTHAKK